MDKILRKAAVSLAFAAFILPSLFALPQENPPSLAALTGLPPALSITDYDISLRTDLESNSVALVVVCTIRNDSPEPAGRIDFDLFAREQFYGMKVKIAGIGRLAGSGITPLVFSRAPLEQPADPSLEGSEEHPLLTRVSLDAPLKSQDEIRVRFEYTLTHVDAKRTNLPYRIIAELPTGLKEICLITDFSWLPWITWSDYAKVQALDKSNFFIKMPRPVWKIAVRHPSDYQALVVDGRLENTENVGNDTVTTWASRTGGLPQLMIGRSDRIVVKEDPVSVVFLLAKGAYDPGVVESMGRFLIRAFHFYSRLFCELPGNEIHIAGSSAGMGGHGAFLGTFLDIRSFQKKGANGSSAALFDETAAHELAHSWWGISITSYGRGTKFLREAFCNFGTWLFAKEEFKMDFFQDNLAYLFFRGRAKERLFEETGDVAGLAYTKGALVLDILRQEMGDETFYRILRLFADKYRNAYVTFTDFVSLCNETTLRDWMPFFIQWCYGEGYPAYHVERFESKAAGGRWKTTVVIRNDGKGSVLCPLALVQGGTPQEEMFFVREGQEKTLVYDTPARVDKVVVDPRHRVFQGDEKESRLKMLGIEETDWPWLNYFMGILHYDLGEKDKALGLFSKAVSGFEGALGPQMASPVLYFSRGVLFLRMGERDKARNDLKLFLDRILGTANRPGNLNDTLRNLSYAVLVSGTDQEKEGQFQGILKALTGGDIGLDPKLAGWRKWWEAHRSTYDIPESASALSPKGYGQ